jgi:hypothetical protein
MMMHNQKIQVSEKCKVFPLDSKIIDFNKLIGSTIIRTIMGDTDFGIASNFLEKRKATVPKLGSALVGIGLIA